MTKRELIIALEESKVNDEAEIKIQCFYDNEIIVLSENTNLNVIYLYTEE